MKRHIKVFIASPNDLSSERKAFKEVIENLNAGFGDGAQVEFEAIGWEDTLATTGRRNQSVINEEIDLCDIFILVFYRRWGQEAPDAKPYTSYTEEEFYRALDRWQKEGKPEIYAFFKKVDPESEADPGAQLTKVLQFRRQLENTRSLIYRTFSDKKHFVQEIDKHLRAFAKGDLPKTEKSRDILILPSGFLEAIEKEKKIAQESLAEAERAKSSERMVILKLEEMQLQLANDAALLAINGQVDYARKKFLELTEITNNVIVLYLSFEFFYRTSEFSIAENILEKWLNLGGGKGDPLTAANVYTNLGNIHLAKGDPEKAEEMYLKAIKFNEDLNRKSGIAAIYGNLGIICRIRSEYKKAEKHFQNSLNIYREIDHKIGIAKQLTNLGVLYQIQENLEKAEEMFRESLAINESLNRKEGLANLFGNLGNIYLLKKEYQLAEDMYRQSLKINTELNRKAVIANDLNNLGVVLRTKGNILLAKELHEKALSLNTEIGRKEGLTNDYGSLGTVYVQLAEGQDEDPSQRIKHLKTAEEMYLKALALSQSMGHKKGTLTQYHNLELLYQILGDQEQAKKMNSHASTMRSQLKENPPK